MHHQVLLCTVASKLFMILFSLHLTLSSILHFIAFATIVVSFPYKACCNLSALVDQKNVVSHSRIGTLVLLLSCPVTWVKEMAWSKAGLEWISGKGSSPSGWLGTGTGSPQKQSQHQALTEFKKHLDHTLRHMVRLLGCPGEDQALQSIVLIGAFQFRVLYDSTMKSVYLWKSFSILRHRRIWMQNGKKGLAVSLSLDFHRAGEPHLTWLVHRIF